MGVSKTKTKVRSGDHAASVFCAPRLAFQGKSAGRFTKLSKRDIESTFNSDRLCACACHPIENNSHTYAGDKCRAI